MPERFDSSKRSRYAVLVTDAETLAGIGVIRSLGRAGYRVVAASADANALGLRSRYAAVSLVRPEWNRPELLPWLRTTIADFDVCVIIPSESVLRSMRSSYAEFAHLVPYAADPSVVDRGLSKFTFFEALGSCAGSIRDHLPPTRLIDADDAAPAPDELRAMGLPIFLKADAERNVAPVTQSCATAEDALHELARLRRTHRRIVVQGFVPGCGVGAFFLLRGGRVLAEFMHRRIHEVPHTGGVSSLRASWRHDAIRVDALAKLQAIQWQGVAMMEYRWDLASDAFVLMELNGRFWGSLHLALYAGVDFPAMLVDAHLGGSVKEIHDWTQGVHCRHTLPRELQHVWSICRDRRISRLRKTAAIAKLAALSLDPRMRTDLGFPCDRGLYWLNLGRVVRELLRDMTQTHPSRARKEASQAHTFPQRT